jgi:hypothetical protein
MLLFVVVRNEAGSLTALAQVPRLADKLRSCHSASELKIPFSFLMDRKF